MANENDRGVDCKKRVGGWCCSHGQVIMHTLDCNISTLNKGGLSHPPLPHNWPRCYPHHAPHLRASRISGYLRSGAFSRYERGSMMILTPTSKPIRSSLVSGVDISAEIISPYYGQSVDRGMGGYGCKWSRKEGE